jgi:RNA binding exosome subunit
MIMEIHHNTEAESTFGKGISVVFPGSTFRSFFLSSESTVRSQEGHYNLACKEFNDSFGHYALKKHKTFHILMTKIVKHYH